MVPNCTMVTWSKKSEIGASILRINFVGPASWVFWATNEGSVDTCIPCNFILPLTGSQVSRTTLEGDPWHEYRWISTSINQYPQHQSLLCSSFKHIWSKRRLKEVVISNFGVGNGLILRVHLADHIHKSTLYKLSSANWWAGFHTVRLLVQPSQGTYYSGCSLKWLPIHHLMPITRWPMPVIGLTCTLWYILHLHNYIIHLHT